MIKALQFINILEKHDTAIEIVLGFLIIFAGDLIINLFRKGKKITPFMRVLLCTAFTCGVSVIKELAEFFCDYYFENSEWQNYSYVPEADIFLFRIFGAGAGNVGQYHVMDTDFDFMCMLLGCAAGGGLLLLVSSIKEKNKRKKEEKNAEPTEKLSV